jgi:hypothetical protein
MSNPRLTIAAAILLLGSPFAHATTIFYDDFESPITASNYWPESSDSDPTVPVIGQPWTVAETGNINAQEVDHIQFLPGGTYPKPTPPPGSVGYPSFAAAEGQQYLHTIFTLNVTRPWIQFSPSQQAAIAAAGYLKLSMKTFGLSGHDGWHSGISVIGFDSAPESLANRAFDVSILENGYGSATGAVRYYNGVGIVPTTLIHDTNTWEDLVIEANFNTDTFSITLDGVTYNNATWAGDLSKIQSIVIGPYDLGSDFRAGFDNVRVEIPEPASAGVVGISAVFLLAARRRRAC